MNEVETINRNREEDEYKKNSEYDKLNALMEQKVEMIEKEMSDYKIKFTAKDADFKEVNKELNRTRKELQNLTNKNHQIETEYQEQIKELK